MSDFFPQPFILLWILRQWGEWSSMLCNLHQNKSVCSLELSSDVSGTVVTSHISSLNMSPTCANTLLKTSVCSVAAHNRMCCYWLHVLCFPAAIGLLFTLIWHLWVVSCFSYSSFSCMDVSSCDCVLLDLQNVIWRMVRALQLFWHLLQ